MDARAEVETTLLSVVGGSAVTDLVRLTGGASRETWRGSVDGVPVVAQRQSAESERDMQMEASVLRAAEAAGVPAPRVLDCVSAGDGVVTLVTKFAAGETIARKLLRDDEFASARELLTEQLAVAAARIHRIDPADVPGLEVVDTVAFYREVLDELDEAHPAFELAFRWLDDHRPASNDEPVRVLHGDLRLGNVIVDRGGLVAVIDWELAQLGHPLQDLAWMCVPAWRFGSPKPVAGVGEREDLLAAYNAEAEAAYTLDDLLWWEICGTLRWGVMCMTQARRHLGGTTRSHELAAIGRRVCENEYDILTALEGRW